MSKNVDGSKGKVCNNCGGYGFTNNLQGSSSGCFACGQTGVEMPGIHELQKQVEELKNTVRLLMEPKVNNVNIR